MEATSELDEADEACTECGFDAVDWNRQDSATTLATIGPRAGYYVEALDPAQLDSRLDPARWSIAEYLGHLTSTLWTIGIGLDLVLADPGRDFGPEPAEPTLGEHQHIADRPLVGELDAAAVALGERLLALAPGDWETELVIGGRRRNVVWLAHHANHDAAHHLHDIGRLRRLIEPATMPTPVGRVAQLNTSDGGVPKSRISVGSIDVTSRGVVGDRQADRRHHGRPWQALCLFRSETIAELQVEGHPISAGLAGENITIEGLDWVDLRAGSIVDIGPVRCEVSAYAIPCAKNAAWFADRDHERILHERHPGSSRLYASVLQPGEVREGDSVTVVAS